MWSDSDDDTTISTSKSKHVIQMYQTISEKTQQKCRQHRTHHTLCHWNHLWQKQIESLLSTFLRSAFQFWGDLDNCWKRQKGHVDSQYVCGDLFNKRKLVANLRWKISFFKRILPIESTQKEKHDQRSNLRSVHFRTKTKAFYGKSRILFWWISATENGNAFQAICTDRNRKILFSQCYQGRLLWAW